jgi:uncharacterized repeat protein (TIGR01451 family)
MKKFNLSYGTHLLCIAAILCLLSSYLWIAPSQVHALSAGSQDDVLGKEQTYMAEGATADNQMAYYDRWKSGYEAGLHSSVFASDQEQTQPQTFALSLEDYLWSTDPFQTDGFSLSISKGDVSQTPGESNPSAPLRQETTLAVDIISSPWAVLDHNDPENKGPHAFVVEAVITNTGSTAATGLVVNLDYNEDPVNNWVLLGGEDPVRTFDEPLAVGEAYHAFWFATYTTTVGLGHEYTVTAWATNAMTVTTSDNYYNPTGQTVETKRALEGGSTRLSEALTDIIVGLAFTATIEWDVGQDPDELILSPIGNVDFDPSSYRLIASKVTFLDRSDPTPVTIATVHDRLYFDTVPASTTHARGEFVFLALRPSVTTFCPYAAPYLGGDFKYDNDYCKPGIPLTGTLTLSLIKQASSNLIQQGQPLTYTLHYTNNGDLPLLFTWIWDDVDTDIGSIISTSIDPTADETTEGHVAWDLGTIPPDGTDTLTFAIRIDGNGQDLADNTSLVNHALFGVYPGSLPPNPALTSTVTTTIQAPAIALSKTDGQETAEPGDALTYTLRITNSGSITATGLIITDVLPADVNYTSGTATPPETSLTGQTLVWNDLAPISPNGGAFVITIPVTVDSDVLDETILTNMMTVKYENPAGHVFATKTAMDTTTVYLLPTVAFTAASQSEAEDVGTMIVTAQLDKVSDLDVTIPFTLSGTATEGAGQDYTITPSPVVIPAGDTSVDIIITVNDDSLYEADETVIVTMGTPTNVNKGTPAVHTATILDNDGAEKPTVAFTAASQSGAEDVGTMTITAQLDKVSGLDVTIPFALSGTATEGAGQDYTITPSPVVIPAGDTSVDIAITVNDDDLDEDAETVIVTMGTPTDADKGTPAVHTATITDNDDLPTVDFSSATYSVGEDAGTAIITVILDAASGRTVTVHYATSDGTATAGSDYIAAGGTLTFTQGVTSQTFAVAITDDALAEDDETVTLGLSSPTNATLGGNNPATLTIMDDDGYNIYLPIILRSY